MPELFKNKYRIEPARLKYYDYSQTGWYFITICTNNRELFFENSKIKDITQRFYLEIPKHFENVRLDKWIIMPNHLHGIIIIGNPVGARHGVPNGNDVPNEIKKGVPRHAPTGFGPLKHNSLSSIINHFKGNVKRWCNKMILNISDGNVIITNMFTLLNLKLFNRVNPQREIIK